MTGRNILHLTTVHPREDTRILYREVQSIAKSDTWKPSLVVADGKGQQQRRFGNVDVTIYDIGRLPRGRLGRIVIGSYRAFRFVRSMRPSLVHFHDPEFIPAGLVLKILGAKVIYDVHEDLPKSIHDKYWVPVWMRFVLAWFVGFVELIGVRAFDGIVCATPPIAARFSHRNMSIVQNFPILDELGGHRSLQYKDRKEVFAYIGVLSERRGTYEMLEALNRLHDYPACRLELAGMFRPLSFERRMKRQPGWGRTTYHGQVTRQQISKLLERVRGGLVTLHPTPAYIDAYPVKLFEYMAAGLPVIASDFPLWRNIVREADCGLLVDPRDPGAIANAMRWILENPEEAEEMGRRGRLAAIRKYNWATQEENLLSLYRKLPN